MHVYLSIYISYVSPEHSLTTRVQCFCCDAKGDLYVYVYIYIYIYTCIYVQMYTYIYLCLHVCMCIYISISIYICLFLSEHSLATLVQCFGRNAKGDLYIYLFIQCTYAFIYISLITCMYEYLCIYKYILYFVHLSTACPRLCNALAATRKGLSPFVLKTRALRHRRPKSSINWGAPEKYNEQVLVSVKLKNIFDAE